MSAKLKTSAFGDLTNLITGMPGANVAARKKAELRQAEIAVPSGELGTLSELAIWVASWQKGEIPAVSRPQVVVFAASHGVAGNGVSAYGMDETASKIQALTQGKCGVNQIAGTLNCSLRIVELAPELPTPDITKAAALSEQDCAATFAFGMEAIAEKPDLLAIGVVGAGATTAAGAVALALFGGSASFWAVSGSAVQKPDLLVAKATAIDAAIAFHRGYLDDPLEIMRRLGGRDLAAVAGAIVAARYERIPVLLDGFAATAAAALLHAIEPGSVDHCMVGAVTSRDSHHALLGRISKKPILELNMGLGDGSGAAMAVGIVRSALACHNGIGLGDPAAI